MNVKTFYFYLNVVLFAICSIVFIFIFGRGILVIIDDFSLLYSPNYTTSQVLTSFLKILIHLPISLLLTLYFGNNILKSLKNNDYLRKKKFKFVLPIVAFILTIIGILLLIGYGMILIQSDPSITEVGEGVGFGIVFLFVGGLITSTAFGIIGFFIDKHYMNQN
ncbi:MAG: hypothetical protein Q7S01_02910 [bacterium]|nr:hypothetical protein [bacterium]